MPPTVTLPVMVGRLIANCWVSTPPMEVVTTSTSSGSTSEMVNPLNSTLVMFRLPPKASPSVFFRLPMEPAKVPEMLMPSWPVTEDSALSSIARRSAWAMNGTARTAAARASCLRLFILVISKESQVGCPRGTALDSCPGQLNRLAPISASDAAVLIRVRRGTVKHLLLVLDTNYCAGLPLPAHPRDGAAHHLNLA